jgi:hypothetical protein
MDVVGTVSQLRRPILVSLDSSSQSGQNVDGTNSNITFSLPDSISTPSEEEIALVSFQSFTFMNALNNITPINDTLKVTAVYNVYGIQKSVTSVITIPNGYYNLQQLTYLLNVNIPQVDSAGNVLSFGSSTYVNNAFTQPALSSPVLVNGFLLCQYPALLVQSATSKVTNSHEYVSFTFVVDSSTYGLMSMIGFVPHSTNPQITSGQQTTLLCTPVYTSSGCTYTFSYGNTNWVTTNSTVSTLTLPYIYNLIYTDTLYVELGNTGAQFRAPYGNLSTSNLLISVPILSSFQSLNYYEAKIFMPKFVPNLNLATLPVTIRDQYGTLVDFRGNNWKMNIFFTFCKSEEQEIEMSTRNQKVGRTSKRPLEVVPSNESFSKTKDPLYLDKHHKYSR